MKWKRNDWIAFVLLTIGWFALVYGVVVLIQGLILFKDVWPYFIFVGLYLVMVWRFFNRDETTN